MLLLAGQLHWAVWHAVNTFQSLRAVRTMDASEASSTYLQICSGLYMVCTHVTRFVGQMLCCTLYMSTCEQRL
jgi:hypothetical protein